MRYLSQSVFGFIKRNPAVLYSLSLIVFLPAVLWWYNSFTIHSFERNADFILQNKALAIESVLAEFLADSVDSPEILQEKIKKIARENIEVKELRVVGFENDKFKIVASFNLEEIGNEVVDPIFLLAWSQNQSIATLKAKAQERFWEVVRPITDQDGAKTLFLSSSLSLSGSDKMIAQTTQVSHLVLLALIIVVLFLVIQHTRLFQYLKLYQDLQKVDEMKSSFIRMAIHELQTPITNIRSYAEVLREEIGDKVSANHKEDLSRIASSATSLSELIYDILEVVKIEQGVLDVSLKQIFPRKIIEDIIYSFRFKAEAKGLALSYKQLPSFEKWAIKVNENRLREVLTNLVDNAIKYTLSGTIEVEERIDEKKRKYQIIVIDTGLGISGEDQRRLFEKFYRVKNIDTAGIPGTGLGLWISKNICERMDGSLVLESMQGVGSRFVASFNAVKLGS